VLHEEGRAVGTAVTSPRGFSYLLRVHLMQEQESGGKWWCYCQTAVELAGLSGALLGWTAWGATCWVNSQKKQGLLNTCHTPPSMHLILVCKFTSPAILWTPSPRWTPCGESVDPLTDEPPIWWTDKSRIDLGLGVFHPLSAVHPLKDEPPNY
jgi:hypothetical protein